jgi:tripartite-type tricarboxylate transporter receptor subunit TctC
VEQGYPDLVMLQWYGLFAPAGIPAELKRTLAMQVLAELRAPEVTAQLAASGAPGRRGPASSRCCSTLNSGDGQR